MKKFTASITRIHRSRPASARRQAASKLLHVVVALSLLLSFGLARAEGDGDEVSTTPMKYQTQENLGTRDATPGSASAEPEHKNDQGSQERQPKKDDERNADAATWWSGGGT